MSGLRMLGSITMGLLTALVASGFLFLTWLQLVDLLEVFQKGWGVGFLFMGFVTAIIIFAFAVCTVWGGVVAVQKIRTLGTE